MLVNAYLLMLSQNGKMRTGDFSQEKGLEAVALRFSTSMGLAKVLMEPMQQ